jgi:DNA-binding NarL/FixJ family response regulator
MNGELYLNGDVSRQILDSMLQRSTEPSAVSTDKLSDREFEIFQMIGTGSSIKEISKENLT